jgi:hypothetical protein
MLNVAHWAAPCISGGIIRIDIAPGDALALAASSS